MHLHSRYRELISGRWRGPVASGLRGVLGVLEAPYRQVVGRRNLRFDRGVSPQRRVAAPVISVGNLTVGGTGKTPFVAWLARWFLAHEMPVTIISRGYGSAGGQPNDEALELAARLPGVPHLQDADRVAAAERAIAANPRQVLLLDDAFQHRRLARELDIVLLDALQPFGYERLLPRGLLREPVESLARAQVVALSRSDAVDAARRAEIQDRVRQLAPSAAWLELTHRPIALVSASGHRQTAAEGRRAPVAAFCGIGNPAGFRYTLEASGFTLSGFLELPDHCAYAEREKQRLADWLNQLAVRHVVCTGKDLVKLPQDELAGKRLWALEIELEIARGLSAFEERLKSLLPSDHHRQSGSPGRSRP